MGRTGVAPLAMKALLFLPLLFVPAEAADYQRLEDAAARAAGHVARTAADRPVFVAPPSGDPAARLFVDALAGRLASSGTTVLVSSPAAALTLQTAAERFDLDLVVTVRLFDTNDVLKLVHRERLAPEPRAKPSAPAAGRPLGLSVGGGAWFEPMGSGPLGRIAWSSNACPWELGLAVSRSKTGPERQGIPELADSYQETDIRTWGFRGGASRVWTPTGRLRLKVGANAGLYVIDEREALRLSAPFSHTTAERTHHVFTPDVEVSASLALSELVELQAGSLYKLTTRRYGILKRNFGGPAVWAVLALRL